MLLRRLPEASAMAKPEHEDQPVENKLIGKGLPAFEVSKIKAKFKLWIRKIWQFILEAKDLKPTAATSYKIKKIFGNKLNLLKKPAISPPASTQEIRNEQYFLQIIKHQPKNLANYDALGKFYSDNGKFHDAKDIYLYLTSHDPSNSDYHGRLAYSFYRLGQYDKAAQYYESSLTLDSSHPNRYYNLGLSLDAQLKCKQAVEAFEKAISLEPGNVKYYISLSNSSVKLGNTGQAKEALEKALGIDPNNETVKLKLNQFS